MTISRKAKRDLTLSLALLGVIGFCAYMIVGSGGYMKLRQYQEQVRRLEVRNHDLHETQTALLEQISRLKNDPREIERIAREQYQLARPGDIIVNTPK
ncbi:MAG: septum formation initiator family protein [Acidobacteriota bacterium]|jgi:cell division protein FtsB